MSERMVYLLMTGQYSDRHVIAAYSTREAAEMAQAEFHRRHQLEDEKGERYYDNASIDEYPLDLDVAEVGEFPAGAFRAEVKPDGSAWVCWKDGADPHAVALIRRSNRGVVQYIGYGESIEHARRSAEELRRAHIAGTVVEVPVEAPHETDDD